MSKITQEQRERSDRVTGLVSIVDLRLRDIKANLKIPGPRTPIALQHEILPAMVRLSADTVVYHMTYRLEATSANRRVLEAELTMSVALELKDPTLTERDLEDFGVIGVLDIVHPYVREIVHSLTARMGLPPLVLDVKVPAVMLPLSEE